MDHYTTHNRGGGGGGADMNYTFEYDLQFIAKYNSARTMVHMAPLYHMCSL